jgi:hypothetical protein
LINILYLDKRSSKRKSSFELVSDEENEGDEEQPIPKLKTKPKGNFIYISLLLSDISLLKKYLQTSPSEINWTISELQNDKSHFIFLEDGGYIHLGNYLTYL